MCGDIDAFMTWFQSNGGTVDLHAMGITEFPGSGRGAVALCDIPADYTLFSLPRTLTLSTRTSSLPHLFGLNKWRAHKLHKGWVGLILCLMWEDACAHEQGNSISEAGLWSPYILSLPETFDTPMFWSEHELEELRGTSVVDKIGRQDAERAYHESLVPAIEIVSWCKTAPSLFSPHHLPRWYSLEAYHRAGSRILSRSFTVSRWTSQDAEEQNDDGNDEAGAHDSEGELEANEPDNANTSFGSAMDVDELTPAEDHEDEDEDEDEDDPSDIAMVPMADLLNARWGGENFNTYGDLPNGDLLRRYGHVDLVPLNADTNAARTAGVDSHINGAIATPGNPSDVVEIKANLVVEAVRARWETKGNGERDIAERIEWWLDEGGDDIFVIPHPNLQIGISYELPRELISFTRLLLPSTDFESVLKKGKLSKSKQPDAEVLGVLEEVLRTREAMYAGGTVEEDEQLLSSSSASFTTRRRHATVVRVGEKRVLRIARDCVKLLFEALQKNENRAGKKDRQNGSSDGGGMKRGAGTAEPGRAKKARQ
ncbi:hypothetical protein V8B97DRAFT_2015387 [Scleroderma yunnanense]